MARIPLDPTGNADAEKQFYNIDRMLTELYTNLANSMDPFYSVNVQNASFNAQVSDISASNLGPHVLNLVGQTSGSPVITLPTVAAVVAAGAFVGQAWTLRVLNPGPQTWKLASQGDWLIPQPISALSGVYQDILFTITSVTHGAMSGTAVPIGAGTVATFIYPAGSFSNNGPLNALPVEVQTPPMGQIWGVVTALNNSNVGALLHVLVQPYEDYPWTFSQNIQVLFPQVSADMPEAIWSKLCELQNTNMFALGAFVQWAPPLSAAEAWQVDLTSIMAPIAPMQIPVAAMVSQAIMMSHSGQMQQLSHA